MQNLLNTWLTTSSRRKILLLRHGEIETAGDERRFIGQIDLPLSDVGRKQARYWQSCLAGGSLGAIIASDRWRCRETARIIAGNDGDIETVDELREIDLGQWEGKRVSEVKQRWSEAYRQRGLDMAGFRPPDGESFLDLQRRVVPAFEAAVKRSAPPLLIVTHAGVMRMLLCHFLGMPVENLFRIALGYGAMTLVDALATGYRVHALNLLPG
jgi:broad specificity phosphatase PhoE